VSELTQTTESAEKVAPAGVAATERRASSPGTKEISAGVTVIPVTAFGSSPGLQLTNARATHANNAKNKLFFIT
jgi:hypothetical protein